MPVSTGIGRQSPLLPQRIPSQVRCLHARRAARIAKGKDTVLADERIAARMAERVVLIGGVHKLLASDADFQFGMTVQHIAGFECDGQTIPQAVIDWTMVGKLSPHDFGLIERRVFLIAMASEVRYGNVTQAQFEQIMAGGTPPTSGAVSPQRGGQAADMGQVAAQSQSGPALLADFIGDPANGAPAGDER
jgi:hypothetical protein